jgi:AraC-like DNA-binding protein
MKSKITLFAVIAIAPTTGYGSPANTVVATLMSAYTINIGHIVVMLVFFLLLTGIVYYTRRMYLTKNLALYRNIREQDRLTKELDQIKYAYDSNRGAQNLETLSISNEEVRYRQLIENLHDYLLRDKNFTNPDLTTIKLAKALNTNRTCLFHAIKICSEITLMDYIQTMRLDEAKFLMDTTDLLIDEISEKCGYTISDTFHRQFCERYHLSPAEYRKSKLMEKNLRTT